MSVFDSIDSVFGAYFANGSTVNPQYQPLQPKREWVGLTDEERNDCLVEADPCECLATPEAQQLMAEVEAKLKDKNGF